MSGKDVSLNSYSCCPHLKYNSKIKYDVFDHIWLISMKNIQSCILNCLLIYLNELSPLILIDMFMSFSIKVKKKKKARTRRAFHALIPSLVSLTSLNRPFIINLLASLLPLYSKIPSTPVSVFSWCQATGCNSFSVSEIAAGNSVSVQCSDSVLG